MLFTKANLQVHSDLRRVVLTALQDARRGGRDFPSSTGAAVRAVLAARPDLSPQEALAAVASHQAATTGRAE